MNVNNVTKETHQGLRSLEQIRKKVFKLGNNKDTDRVGLHKQSINSYMLGKVYGVNIIDCSMSSLQRNML